MVLPYNLSNKNLWLNWMNYTHNSKFILHTIFVENREIIYCCRQTQTLQFFQEPTLPWHQQHPIPLSASDNFISSCINDIPYWEMLNCLLDLMVPKYMVCNNNLIEVAEGEHVLVSACVRVHGRVICFDFEHVVPSKIPSWHTLVVVCEQLCFPRLLFWVEAEMIRDLRIMQCHDMILWRYVIFTKWRHDGHEDWRLLTPLFYE